MGRNWHIYVCVDFQDLLAPKWGRSGATLSPNDLVLTCGACYLAATFGEN